MCRHSCSQAPSRASASLLSLSFKHHAAAAGQARTVLVMER